jgi:hypothetical protein
VPDSYPRHKARNERARVDAAGGNEPAELDQIDPAFAVFNLGNPAMGHGETRRQLALCEPCTFSRAAEFGAKKCVFGCMNGFFHCSNYRSVL